MTEQYVWTVRTVDGRSYEITSLSLEADLVLDHQVYFNQAGGVYMFVSNREACINTAHISSVEFTGTREVSGATRPTEPLTTLVSVRDAVEAIRNKKWQEHLQRTDSPSSSDGELERRRAHSYGVHDGYQSALNIVNEHIIACARKE